MRTASEYVTSCKMYVVVCVGVHECGWTTTKQRGGIVVGGGGRDGGAASITRAA